MPHVLQDHIGVAIEGFDAGQDLAVVAAVDQHLDMSRFIRSSCLIYVQSVVNPFSFASCRSCSEWILEPDVNPQGSTMSTQSTLALSSGCLGKQLRSSKGDDRDLCNFRLQILQPPTIPTIHLSDFSLLLH